MSATMAWLARTGNVLTKAAFVNLLPPQLVDDTLPIEQVRGLFARFVDQVEKVGYALATAAGGDLGRGVWAMRRAARIDPQSIHYVNVDPRLAAELHRLTRQYQANLDRGPRDRESAFMVASLQYLAGNMETARNTLQEAVEYGDNRISTQNLARLIEEGSASGASPSGTTPVPNSGSRANGDY